MLKLRCLIDRIPSVRFALAGIWTMLKTQQNAWVHALATVAVIATGLFLGVDFEAWRWLVLAIMLVWIAEAMNTAFEFLADLVSPEYHPLVKQAKDVAAGAVLLAATGAVIIGLLIFIPAIVKLAQ